MGKLKWTTLLLAMMVISAVAQQADSDARNVTSSDREHTQWVDQVMRSISTIKPGMARKDLFRVLVEEGGLSTRSQRRYVYKHCPYIKVDVEFSPSDDQQNESPNDKIVTISRPYLEYTISD
ncbi:MAG TPA: hypothetical protein VIH89_04650 [Candidatus Sulfotelmatobacter sp.]